MSLRRLWAVIRKEIHHILRDGISLTLVALSPLALLFILAYAVTADIRHVPISVLDLDRSPTSRAFIQQITLGEDLDLLAQVDDMQALQAGLLQGKVRAALVIPAGFEHDLLSLRGMPLQVLVDGTEPQTGGYAVDHIGRRAEAFALDVLGVQMQRMDLERQALRPINLSVRTWFNPNLEARVDLIPGLVSIVLGLPGMSVALTLAREREHGTFEQILATPVGRAELLLGKMGPYVISGMINVVLATLIATQWFNVPFRGSFPLYLLLSFVFLISILSVGMVIGVFIRSQAAALALSFLVIFFPGFFLTGVFFPLAALPAIVRTEALSMPGTHYAIVTRGAYISGVGLDVLWPYGLTMLVMGIGLTGVAAFFFEKKLA